MSQKASRPTLRPKEFEELLRIYARLKAERGPRPAGPFVPYVGSRYGRKPGAPRLLFVGKATAGKFLPDDHRGSPTLKAQRALVHTFCSKHLIPGDPEYYDSAFWRFVRLTVGKTFQSCGADVPDDGVEYRRWCMDRLAWDNYMKIGTVEGNPAGDAVKSQVKICQTLLQRNIRRLAPTGVVLLVHNAYWEEMTRPLFYEDGVPWKQMDGRALWSKDGPLNMSAKPFRIYWMFHPERKTTAQLNTWAALIAADQAKRWQLISHD
jgi:hypothetical protein